MGGFEIRQKNVFVIAEIGKNFIQTREDRPVSEYFENAKTLVRLAKESGADAVKFQTHNVEDEQLPVKVVSPHFKGADRYSWVKRNTEATPFGAFWRPLKRYCDESKILFFSTPMSRGAARILNKLGARLWKVGSADLLDFVMLDYLASTGKPIILSTGMSTLAEVDRAIDFLRRRKARIAALLHCVSKYPCPPRDLNLATIAFFQKRCGLAVGFSDHSLGVESALAAVALGATVIEKHFSLSRSLWGADHKVSMTPPEFRALVDSIRKMEQDPSSERAYLQRRGVSAMLGSPKKILQEDEAVLRPYFRKSLVAARDIAAGAVLEPEMIFAMRPQKYAGGLPSEDYESALGRTLSRGLKKHEAITPAALL